MQSMEDNKINYNEALDNLFAPASSEMSFEQLFEPHASPFEQPASSFDDCDSSPSSRAFGLETPSSTAFTSPQLHDFDDATTSPMARMDQEVEDLFGQMPLFGFEPAPVADRGLGSIESRPLNVLDLDMSGLVPMTPAQAPSHFLPSPVQSAASSSPPFAFPTASLPATTTQNTRATSIARDGPTGHRRNITASSLVSVEAPTQPRTYTKPSATSRKEIPAAFQSGAKASKASKKRQASEAFEAEVGEGGSLEDAIEAKRRQNTVAARRSRMRKLEYVRELETRVEDLQRERDEAIARAERAEALLRGEVLP